jgi:hypothetical protein
MTIPEVAETGLAVLAVLVAFRAWSTVPEKDTVTRFLTLGFLFSPKVKGDVEAQNYLFNVYSTQCEDYFAIYNVYNPKDYYKKGNFIVHMSIYQQ